MVYAGRNNSGTFNLRKNEVRSKYCLGLFGASASRESWVCWSERCGALFWRHPGSRRMMNDE